MKWLGVDIECNRIGIWNIGIALFQKTHCLESFNIFIEEFFSPLKKHSYGLNYLKTKDQLNESKNPVWVRTQESADKLTESILKGWGFHRSFGYNSSVFDLQKLQGTYPKTLNMLLSKPHLDLMPLVLEHLIKRKQYKEFWEQAVKQNLTTAGNPDFVKYSAELVLNYIGHIRHKGKWEWKEEDHIGVEDLIYFEYPILHYFLRILKKKTKIDNTPKPFLKWDDIT